MLLDRARGGVAGLYPLFAKLEESNGPSNRNVRLTEVRWSQVDEGLRLRGSMKRSISLLVFVAIQVLSVGCGQTELSEAEPVSLEEQLQALGRNSNSAIRTAVKQDGSVDGVTVSSEVLLDLIYGANSQVNRVVMGALGAHWVQPSANGNFPVSALVTVFEKDASGKFQLTAGNPLQIRSVPFSSLHVFLAAGVIPVAAGGAGFCAGTRGRAVQSGALALGLGISTRGQPLFIAGAVFRAGSEYQACSTSGGGCTKVTNIPAPLATLFPACQWAMQ